MIEDIRAMTSQLAQDPASLVFLSLAEALRKRGQLDAALTVAVRGVTRYPEAADAHDLLARIRADRGEGDAAFDSWTTVLRLAPDHLGAHKGLAFLSYRSGDLARSLRHLTRALELAPEDAALARVGERVRALLAARAPETPRAEPTTGFGDGPGEAGHTLLLDQQGRVLAGSLQRADRSEAGEAVAAALGGVSREAERATRLLGLGQWRAIAIEGGGANYELRSPTPETVLFAMRDRGIPAGRLSRLAERAATTARKWLEQVQ